MERFQADGGVMRHDRCFQWLLAKTGLAGLLRVGYGGALGSGERLMSDSHAVIHGQLPN